MAVALILDFPGGTKAQYDEVVEKMDLHGRMAPGGLFHAAGSSESGWRVIDVWEDMATFERFRDEKIIPITREVGLARPSVRAFDVYKQRAGTGADPVLVQVVNLPGIDAAGFDEIDGKVIPGGGDPEHMTFHVNGPVEGGFCVIDGWDSKAERDRFMAENIQPAAQGSALTGPPRIEDLDVEATMREGAHAPV
jgi:hypothetical protein